MRDHPADEVSSSSAPFADKPSPEALLIDQDTGDLASGVDEDALDHDELDTDQIASPS